MDIPQCAASPRHLRPLVNVFDGSLNIHGAGTGILFISPNKDKLCYILRIIFSASNNVAEYQACLRLAVKLGVKHLYVHDDPALVIK